MYAVKGASPGAVVALAVLVMLVVSGCSSSGSAAGPPAARTVTGSSAGVSAAERERRVQAVAASAVLRRWDQRRAAAYAAVDPAALGRLYTAHSPARRADVRLLERYAARGLVVSAMRTQVLELTVHRWGKRRLEVRVLDRLARTVAAVDGRRRVHRTLPSDAVDRWLLVLVRRDGRWRMRSVTGAGRS